MLLVLEAQLVQRVHKGKEAQLAQLVHKGKEEKLVLLAQLAQRVQLAHKVK